LFVTHLKSKFVPFEDPDPVATALANDRLRTRQAETIARVVSGRTRPDTRYLVLGDLNDVPAADTLAPMAAGLGLVDALADVVESRPPPPATAENSPTSVRWTFRQSVANGPDTFELLDQIWLGPALAGRVAHAEIERRRGVERQLGRRGQRSRPRLDPARRPVTRLDRAQTSRIVAESSSDRRGAGSV
ncbi:MAG: hypothetical protein ACRDIL_00020, partial [Candidatus Limnocylindrales bacterium]